MYNILAQAFLLQTWTEYLLKQQQNDCVIQCNDTQICISLLRKLMSLIYSFICLFHMGVGKDKDKVRGVYYAMAIKLAAFHFSTKGVKAWISKQFLFPWLQGSHSQRPENKQINTLNVLHFLDYERKRMNVHFCCQIYACNGV